MIQIFKTSKSKILWDSLLQFLWNSKLLLRKEYSVWELPERWPGSFNETSSVSHHHCSCGIFHDVNNFELLIDLTRPVSGTHVVVMPVDFTFKSYEKKSSRVSCCSAEQQKFASGTKFIFWLKLLGYSRKAGRSEGLTEHCQADNVLCQMPRIERRPRTGTACSSLLVELSGNALMTEEAWTIWKSDSPVLLLPNTRKTWCGSEKPK